MAKSSGLGSQFYVDQFDLSGDIGSLSGINGTKALLDVTGINKLAYERIGGLGDGEINFNTFFNPSPLAEHAALSTLPTTDRLCSYMHSAAIGSPVAELLAKQVNYDWTRGQDGSLIGQIQALASTGKPLEWAFALTAGVRTDTVPTNGASFDDLLGTPISTDFGLAFYVHLLTFTGTDITFTIDDSANDSAFAPVTGAAIQRTAVGTSRVQTTLTQNVRRYLRLATSGTFSNATFVVSVIRYINAQLHV